MNGVSRTRAISGLWKDTPGQSERMALLLTGALMTQPHFWVVVGGTGFYRIFVFFPLVTRRPFCRLCEVVDKHDVAS